MTQSNPKESVLGQSLCKAVLTIAFLFVSSGYFGCFAAGGSFSGAIGGVAGLYDSIAALLQIILVIGAMIVLVMIVLRIMQGDRESAVKLGWWLLGIAFGFTMITVLSQLADKII